MEDVVMEDVVVEDADVEVIEEEEEDGMVVTWVIVIDHHHQLVRYSPDYYPGYAPRYVPWLTGAYWFGSTCKDGCTNVGNDRWGCQFPGGGSNDCVFASDCYGCGF